MSCELPPIRIIQTRKRVTEFKDKIRAAGGKVEFLYDPMKGIATQISGSGFIAMYLVAVSMDGRHLLATVPATGIGRTAVYPQPSIITYIQSDELGMWGRNCPACQKYFRTNHIMGLTFCPYCSVGDDSLAFISQAQRTYITACYDAFGRAYVGKKNTSVDVAEITDDVAAWHYSEEKLQTHFKCDTKDCRAETDILGEYGFCPRCGRTNARKFFFDRMSKMLIRWEEVNTTISDRREREDSWEKMTIAGLSEFEALAKHLRARLLLFPMTPKRRKRVLELNFQKPFEADALLAQWFDIGVLKWTGNKSTSARAVPEADFPFIKKMIQRRHILMHNGGVVDQEYLDLSNDTQVRLGERIRVRSKESKRFIEYCQQLGANLMDNVEDGFTQE
jgi:hypothetical protein